MADCIFVLTEKDVLGEFLDKLFFHNVIRTWLTQLLEVDTNPPVLSQILCLSASPLPDKEEIFAPARGIFLRGLTIAVLFLCSFSLSQSVDSKSAASEKDIASVFTSTEVKIQVEPGKQSFTAEWEYTNPGEFPLVVEHIDSSCGCLAAQASEYKQVKQGEFGKITAQFQPGSHRGLLRKSLHVRFVGHDKPIELVVEAHIPSPVELSTQQLIWTEDNKDKPQVVEVASGTGQDFTITGLLGVPERLFTIEKETVSDKRHYRLHITPTGEPAPGIQTLQVRTDSRDPRDQIIAVFLRVP